MTFKDIQDEVIALTFDSSLRASIKQWINLEYQFIWEYADWDFKTIPSANLSVIANDNSPVMPAEFRKALDVYDTQGYPLTYLRQREWEYNYLNAPTSSQPEAYMVVNGQIYIGPTPGASGTYKLSYERRLAHVDQSLGIIGGTLQQDTDQCIWPAEHDYTLVYGAAYRGAVLTNRLDAPTYEAERDRLLLAMKKDLVNDAAKQVEFWGGDWNLCY